MPSTDVAVLRCGIPLTPPLRLSPDSSLYSITKADNRFVVLKDGGGYVIVRHVSDKSGSVKWAIRRKLVNFFSVV